jgi:Xaa-Pro aminopeptidase
MVKSPAEIEVLRRAARITVKAIEQAARLVADGVDERKLEAEFEATCKREGAQRPAFSPIVKSGPNALFPWPILAAHYDRRNRVMRSGELVVLDVGCEVDHYVSDVGRTFPVSGRFHPEQRRVLAMELAVADAMIAAIRPGATLAQVQAAGAALVSGPERPFMQAPLYFGHHVGLSAADPSLEEAPLEPGMVLTVEPWYYNRPRGLVAFTEDVVLVTATGAENLTAVLARTPEALEAAVTAGRGKPRSR